MANKGYVTIRAEQSNSKRKTVCLRIDVNDSNIFTKQDEQQIINFVKNHKDSAKIFINIII